MHPVQVMQTVVGITQEKTTKLKQSLTNFSTVPGTFSSRERLMVKQRFVLMSVFLLIVMQILTTSHLKVASTTARCISLGRQWTGVFGRCVWLKHTIKTSESQRMEIISNTLLGISLS